METNLPLNDIRDLLNEVSRRADAANGKVALALLETAKKTHAKTAYHGDCNCSFCRSLKCYVQHKIKIHHINKTLRDVETEEDSRIMGVQAKIDMHRMFMKRWREIKNQEFDAVL